MVSSTISLMTARVETLVPCSGVKDTLMSLLDPGCTQYLISLPTVEKLGLRLRKLRQPMGYEQLDNLMERGCSSDLLDGTRTGKYIETICLIVVPGIIETMILGLAWLKK